MTAKYFGPINGGVEPIRDALHDNGHGFDKKQLGHVDYKKHLLSMHGPLRNPMIPDMGVEEIR